MLINTNNLKQLGTELAEVIDRIIPESQLEKLSEKQRAFLGTLIYLNSTGQLTRDGQPPIAVIKDILGIKPYLDKKETFLKLKFK